MFPMVASKSLNKFTTPDCCPDTNGWRAEPSQVFQRVTSLAIMATQSPTMLQQLRLHGSAHTDEDAFRNPNKQYLLSDLAFHACS